jgi:chitodextrinase
MTMSSRQGAVPPQLIVSLSGVDTQAPTAPSGVTATAVSHADVAVSWSASSDDVAVTGYSILRDGAPVGSVDGTTLSFHDTTVTPSTTYAYTVTASDAAGNVSDPSSPPAGVTTPAAPAVLTFAPVADAYVDAASPTKNYGTATTLRADASPVQRSYLRFNVAGITGPIVSAKLRIYANSSSTAGHQVCSVSDTGWGETTITSANAPPLGPVTGSSGPFTSGHYVEVDVSSLVTGNGLLSLGFSTPSSTGIAYSSREGANPPQLVINQQ